MKLFQILLVTAVFTACSGTDSNTSSSGEITPPGNADSTTGTSSNGPVSAMRAYGQSLLDGSVKPANNKETIACLDSMMGVTQDTRDYFFDVYLTISGNTDGVLGETASEKALAYFEQFPKEAIENYKSLEKGDKEIFIEDLAFEFYASGGDIASDVNECIDTIEKNCKECSADHELLENLGLEVIRKANKLKTTS